MKEKIDYDLTNYDFGKLLKKYRKKRKITQEELAYRINKTKSTVNKYENNKIVVDFFTVIEICNALKITLEELSPKMNSFEENSNEEKKAGK